MAAGEWGAVIVASAGCSCSYNVSDRDLRDGGFGAVVGGERDGGSGREAAWDVLVADRAAAAAIVVSALRSWRCENRFVVSERLHQLPHPYPSPLRHPSAGRVGAACLASNSRIARRCTYHHTSTCAGTSAGPDSQTERSALSARQRHLRARAVPDLQRGRRCLRGRVAGERKQCLTLQRGRCC